MNLIAYINREEKKRLRLFEVCALKTKCIMKILVNKHERSNIFEVDGCFLLIFLNRNTLEWWKKQQRQQQEGSNIGFDHIFLNILSLWKKKFTE